MGNQINQEALQQCLTLLTDINQHAVESLNALKTEFAKLPDSYNTSSTQSIIDNVNMDIANAINYHTNNDLENGLNDVITFSLNV